MPTRINLPYLIFILLMLFGISRTSTAAALKVTIPQQGISLSYQSAPRLSQLLTDANKNIDYTAYFLGSALINKDNKKNAIQNSKIKLLKDIESISNKSASHLHTIVEGLTLYQQEDLKLDLEKIQQDSRQNPIISGNYQLYLPKRPDYIILIDPKNSDEILKLKLISGYHLENYLSDHYKSRDFSTDNIRIIQADKEVITPKIDYWSSKKYYLSPGAIIYVGLNIDKAETINQKVTNLLQQHVVY